jgi:hypothetical protein
MARLSHDEIDERLQSEGGLTAAHFETASTADGLV